MAEFGVCAWDRLAGEPTRWHDRFEVYRSLGPERTVAHAYRAYLRRMGRSARNVDKAWYAAARRWGWQERAAQWDDAERRRLRQDEQTLRTRAYYERVDMIAQVLRSALKVFAAADLENLSVEEARKLIPAIRPLFREMLNAYRIETGGIGETSEMQNRDGAPDEQLRLFSADELGKAAAETHTLVEAEESRAQEWRIAPGAAWSALRDALAHLYPERADALRVAEEAGLDVRRIDAAGSPLAVWDAVLREARHAGRMDALLDVASREYDSFEPLRDARAAWERDRLTGAAQRPPHSAHLGRRATGRGAHREQKREPKPWFSSG